MKHLIPIKYVFAIAIANPLQNFMNAQNYSIHFDFMSGYAESIMNTNDIFGQMQPFTVEAWYKNNGVDSGNNSGYDDGANIVSSYRRSGGGDPYGFFGLSIRAGNSPENPGKAYTEHGTETLTRVDDGSWHHIAATYEPNEDGSWNFRIYLDGILNDETSGPDEDYNHTGSSNKIRMNNHSPFAGDHMLDCSYAGMSITSGARYTSNFVPQFPLESVENTIVNLDFTSGDGNQLNDNSGNNNTFNLNGSFQWSSDVPTSTMNSQTTNAFEPVEPTGLPYQAIITNLTVNGAPPSNGTVIGIFDGDLCVGTAEYDFSGNSTAITTWGGNDDPFLEGFVSGNAIEVMLYTSIFNTWGFYQPEITFTSGNGSFGAGAFTAMELSLITEDQPNISISAQEIVFNPVAIGGESSGSITIGNDGNLPLEISNIYLSGGGPFSLSGSSGILQPGETLDIDVLFTADAAQNYVSQITIVSDDPDSGELIVSIYGQGLPIEAPSLQIDHYNIDFGLVSPGAVSSRNLNIQNTGSIELTISSISLSGSEAFSVNDDQLTVQSGSVLGLPITFSSNESGYHYGDLNLVTNDPNLGNITINMVGLVQDGYFAPVAQTGLPYTVVFDSIVVDRQLISSGTEIGLFDYDYLNDVEVCVGSYEYEGSQFPIQVTAWQSDLDQGLSGYQEGSPIIVKLWTTTYDTTIEFSPPISWTEGQGIYGQGQFVVGHIAVESGLEPVISLGTNFIELPDVAVGDLSENFITIQNTGQTKLTINNYNISDPSFSVNFQNFEVPSGGSRDLGITFTPQEARPYQEELTLLSNDPFDPSVTISMNAQGLPPDWVDIIALNDSIVIPKTAVGDSSTFTVDIFNQGSGSVEITAVNITNEQFSSGATGNVVISSGETYPFPLLFHPSEEGFLSATIEFENNGKDLYVNVNGYAFEGFFDVVEPTGLPYQILFTSIESEFVGIQIGDEIGIFDGSTAVGVGVVEDMHVDAWLIEEPINPIVSVSWEFDPDRSMEGFVPGNTVLFRYYAERDGEKAIYEASGLNIEGNGTFGSGQFSVFELNVSSSKIEPEIISPLDDLSIREDSGENEIILDLDTYFLHPFDPLSFGGRSLDTSAIGFIVEGNSTLKVSTKEDWFGNTQAIVFATDGYFFVNDTINIDVRPINDSPYWGSINDTLILEDTEFSFIYEDLLFDVDNELEELQVNASFTSSDSLEGDLTLNLETNSLTFSPATDSSGTANIQMIVIDDSLGSDTVTFDLTVSPVNDSPEREIAIEDKVIYRNNGVFNIVSDLNFHFSDKEGDPLFYEVVQSGDSIETFIQEDRLSINLLGDLGGTEQMVVSASDQEFTVYDTFNVSYLKWSMNLSLSAESGQDIENFIGVSGNGNDGYDSFYEVPYEETSEISLYFYGEGWTYTDERKFNQDIKNIVMLDDTVQVWEIGVVSSVSETATLSISPFDYPGFPFELVNMHTGSTIQSMENIALELDLAAEIEQRLQLKVGDVIVPDQIADLSVVNIGSRFAQINWTAPGDDGMTGFSSNYDIRFSKEIIDSLNFDFALLPDSIPAPEISQSPQQTILTNLEPDQTYFVAIRSTDDAGNVSSLSNVASFSTLPVPLTDLNAIWGNFHGDFQNTGKSNQDGPTLDSLMWVFDAAGMVNGSPSVDAYGNVFFGGDDGILYSLDPQGQLRWSQDVGGGIVSSPLISTMDRVYVTAKNGTINSMNNADGSVIWTFTTADEIQGSPIIFNDGDLFVGDLDGVLYCIDSEFGTLNWQISVGNRIYSTPSLSHNGETLYIGGFDKKIYAIDPQTGAVQWDYLTGGYILSSIAVDEMGNLYATASDRKIYSVDSQGNERWIYQTNGAIWYSSPAIGIDGDVLFGSDDNSLYSLNREDGTIRWAYETGGDIRNSPAITSNGGVYFGSTDNTLYHLNTDGELESSVVLGGQVQRSSVAIGVSGVVMVGTLNNKLYAYGIGDTIAPVTPNDLVATPGENNVQLFWSLSEELDVQRYVLYRNQSNDGTIVEGDSIDFVTKQEHTFADTNVVNGEEYNYAIRAVDISGNRGDLSNIVTVSPIDLPPQKVEEIYLEEANFEIILTWTIGSEKDLQGHKLYKSINPDQLFDNASLFADVELPINIITDDQVNIGQDYYYGIVPYDISGNEGALSDIISGSPKDLTPPPPVDPFIADNGDEEVELGWIIQDSTDATLVNVYRSTDSLFAINSSDLIGQVSYDQISYLDTGLVNGFAYFYRLTALDQFLNESESTSLIIGTPTDKTPPESPVLLSAMGGDHRVDIEWERNLEYDLSHYFLLRSEDENSIDADENIIASIPKVHQQYTDTSSANGVTYYYGLKAVDIGDNVSDISNILVGLPVDLPPGIPQGLAIEPAHASLQLDWIANEDYDLSEYIIRRGQEFVDNELVLDSIASVNAPLTQFVDEGLLPGYVYYYAIAAKDDGGNFSENSDTISSIPLDLVAPDTPQNFTAIGLEKSVQLSWAQNIESDFHRYTIYRSNDSLVSMEVYDTTFYFEKEIIEYLDQNLTNGTEYFYRIVATDTTGNFSDPTEVVLAIPRDITPPSEVNDLIVTTITSTSIGLEWTATGGDSTDGRAYEYDLRFSTEFISNENFNDAFRFDLTEPNISGSLEQTVVVGLDPETEYYFALMVADSLGNKSGLSNILNQATLETPKILTNSLYPKARHDAQNTGKSKIYGNPYGNLVWEYETDAPIRGSATFDSFGNAYFGSEDGHVYSVDVEGETLWSYDTGDKVIAVPTVATLDRLYVGSYSGIMYCFDILSGEIIWQFDANDEIEGSVALTSSGRLFFGDLGGDLYCLSSETGELIWEIEAGLRIYSTPALSHDEETIYFGGYDRKLYSVNKSDGSINWSYQTSGYLLGSPAVDDNGSIYFSASDRKLYKLSSDGELSWRYTSSGPIWYSSPAFDGSGNVYVGSNDYKLHKVDLETGQNVWKFNTSGAITSSPTISDDGNIYFGSGDNKVYSVSSEGEENWQFDTGSEIQISSPSLGPNGNIYIGSTNGNLYVIGELDTLAPSQPENFMATPGDRSVDLNWTANPEADILFYYLLKGITPNQLFNYRTMGFDQTSFVDSNVINNQTYYYALIAVDQLNNESAATETINVTPYDQTPPPPPEDLFAQAGDSFISLSWSDIIAEDFMDYRIHMMLEDSTLQIIGTLSNIFDTTFTIENLENSVTYQLFVSARDTLFNESSLEQFAGNTTPYNGPNWYISPNGSDESVGYITDPFRTIQHAINISNDNDSIYVLEGIFPENLSIVEKNIIISGVGNPENIIIDGSENGSVIVGSGIFFNSITIENLTIQNGVSVNGGGLNISDIGVVIDRVIFRNNISSDHGGGLFYSGVQGEISNSVFSNNQSPSGAGIFAGSFSSLNIINSTFVENFSSQGSGSIVLSAGTFIEVLNTLIMEQDGSSISMDPESDPSTLIVDHSYISDGLSSIIQNSSTLEWGEHNIDHGEAFSVNRSTNNSFHPSEYSYVIGNGHPSVYSEFDLYKNPRPNPSGTLPDIGAVELELASRRPFGQEARDGSSEDRNWFSESFISINWDPFEDNDTLLVYEVRQIHSDTSQWENVGSNLETSMNVEIVDTLGHYFFEVRAIDADGQFSNIVSTDGFSFDLDKPVMTSIFDLDESEDRDFANNETELTFHWTGFDQLSGIFEYQYIFTDTIGLNIDSIWISTGLDSFVQINDQTLTEGNEYKIIVRAVDIAGNISEPLESDGFTFDSTPPISGIIFDGGTGDQTFSGSDSSLTVRWTDFSDNESSIDYYLLSVGTSEENNNILDNFIIPSDSLSATINEIELQNGSTYYSSIVAVDLAGNMADRVISTGITIDTDPPSLGNVYDGLNYVDVDWSNINDVYQISFDGFIDSISGWVEYSVALGSAPGSDDMVRFTSFDTLVQISLNGFSLIEGETYFGSVIATDSLGNQSGILTSNGFTIDLTNPFVSMDIDRLYYGPTFFEFEEPVKGSSADDNSGVSSIEISCQRDSDDLYWNGSSWETDITWLFTSGNPDWEYDTRLLKDHLENGVMYTFSGRSIDNAGNIGIDQGLDSLFFDNVRPITTANFDGEFYNEDSWNWESTLSGIGYDSLSGIDSVRISVERLSDNQFFDGTSWNAFENWFLANGTDQWTFPVQDLVLEDGVSYRAQTIAYDIAGNEESPPASATFSFDTTPPTAGNVYDGSEQSVDLDWSNETSIFAASWNNFSDATSGIQFYEYRINNQLGDVVLDWTSSGQDTTILHTDLGIISGNSYYVHVRATDHANNVSNIAVSDGLAIDTIPPVVTELGEGSVGNDIDFQYSSTELSIFWTGSDTREINGYEIGLGTGVETPNVIDWVDVGSTNSFTFEGLNLSSGGVYFAFVRGYDQAGNVSGFVNSDGITIDQDIPQSGTVMDNSEIDIDWTYVDYQVSAYISGFQDLLSGIMEYYVSVGINPGGDQITEGWQSIGLDTTTVLSLDLQEGPTYFINVYAVDLVGNQSDVVSSDGFGIDITQPISGTILDGNEVDLTWSNIDTSLAANWFGFSDELSGLASFQVSVGTSQGGLNILPWTQLDPSNVTINVPDLNLNNGSTYYFNIFATDIAGNESEMISSNGVTIDTEAPNVSYIYESANNNANYHGSADSLSIFADAIDELSGVQEFEFCLGSIQGECDLANWNDGIINSGEFFITIQNLNLENGFEYYGSIRVSDFAGNETIQSGDGVTLDIEPPQIGALIDVEGIQDSMDISITNNLELLGFRILDPMDELSGIAYYEYAVGTNPGSVDVMSWTTTSEEFNIINNLNLEHAQRYFISVKSTDNIGNTSSVLSTNGVDIDEFFGPPFISDIDLIPGSIISNSFNTNINLTLSEPIQGTYDVKLQSEFQNNYTFDVDYIGSEQKLNIDLYAPLNALDTLYFSISNLTDLLGYVSDTTELNYFVPLVGDFNRDYEIDILDLNTFSAGWQNNDLTAELGPVSGEAPFFTPEIDGALDLRDIMTFARMWHWSQQTGQAQAITYSLTGDALVHEQVDDILYLSLPEGATSANLIVQYPSTGSASFPISENEKEKLHFVTNDVDAGHITLNKGILDNEKNERIGFRFKSDLREEAVLILNYAFLNQNNEIISSGQDIANYRVIPDSWELHQNYPNPFNPVTNIDFDIPSDALVEMNIYDILGREVKQIHNGNLKAGFHSIEWDGTNSFGGNVGGGIYFCSLVSNGFHKTIKLILLK